MPPRREENGIFLYFPPSLSLSFLFSLSLLPPLGGGHGTVKKETLGGASDVATLPLFCRHFGVGQLPPRPGGKGEGVPTMNRLASRHDRAKAKRRLHWRRDARVLLVPLPGVQAPSLFGFNRSKHSREAPVGVINQAKRGRRPVFCGRRRFTAPNSIAPALHWRREREGRACENEEAIPSVIVIRMRC